MKRILFFLSMMVAILAHGEQSFKSLVGPVRVGNVKSTHQIDLPFIAWGGDIATFYANGGITTKPGSIFQKEGLDFKLVNGDDFIQQVRNYMSGKTPFLRGTFRMIGQASEVINSDPRTKGVAILQMTWSQGDHLVSRGNIKSVSDLKGKKIALQQGGPHVGMLDDILRTAKLNWEDVDIVWCKDLAGTPNSPAEMFRKNSDIVACCVISPDMLGLCGGLQTKGSGAEGTVKGSKVLVSTAEMSRSIADIYVCRKDFYDSHRDLVQKFVIGYLKAVEEVIDLKAQYEKNGSKKYMALLKLAQDIFGKDVVPTLEEDAHGMLCDCKFVGYPGNVAFFTQKNNMHGFDVMNEAAMSLAVSRGYASIKCALLPPSFNYKSSAFLNKLNKTDISKQDKFRAEAVVSEIEELSCAGGLDDKTIVSFTVNFKPNQTEFHIDQYGAEFQRVVEMADKYGNAVIAVRGHTDPTKTLLEMVKAGLQKGILRRSGSKSTGYHYSLNGKPLDLNNTKQLVDYIKAGEFDNVPGYNPRATMQAALNLSRKRAEAVRDAVIKYAHTKGLEIDKSQIQPVGVGVREPFIAKPRNAAEAEQNMRCEFRLIRVEAETTNSSEFDF